MLDRREFLMTMGGVAVIASAEPASHDPFPANLDAWLHIGPDGVVTVHTGKVELGQGPRTSLAQAAAEELRTPFSQVRMLMGQTPFAPYEAGTFGSRTTPYMMPQIRKAAATARELLVEIAAKKWNAEPASLVAGDGRVRHPATGRTASYGDLAAGQKLVANIKPDVALTPAANWSVSGKPIPKVGAEDIVTGRQKYVSDLSLPGLLHGRIVRPPSFGAKLISAEIAAAEALPGVRVVRDGDFLGVVAADARTAARAASLVKAEWKQNPQISSRDLFAYLKEHAERSASPHTERGSVQKAMADAATKLSQTYTVAYIAHCPLEPRAAVAHWTEGGLSVWTASQRPYGIRTELASAFQMDEERVRVTVPDSGGAYGGKHSGDAALEAAKLARGSSAPVKVAWTREEEFWWAYFRPAGVIEVASAADRGGRITAWDFVNINSGGAGLQIAYDVSNVRIAYQESDTPLRSGSYRALAATANHFARETHIDELAHACGIDPLQFRLTNTRDTRFRAVLEAAAERFGWGKRKPAAGRGFGIAGGWEKGSYVATCVEVSSGDKGGPVRLERIVEAFECGAIVNPDNLANQVEGCIVMGLGGALFEAVDFANGRILNGRFSRYRVPRFGDVPPIETVLLDRKDLPSAGAGETPIVGIAPAIGNAIFASTGERKRSLPMMA